MKCILQKPTTNIILNEETHESISSKIRNMKIVSPLITHVYYNIWNISQTSYSREKIKLIWIGKEVKIYLFANEMIYFIENPKIMLLDNSQNDKQVQEHDRIQNKHTKISFLLAYQESTHQERDQENNYIFNSFIKLYTWI